MPKNACQPIREDIKTTEAEIISLDDLLDEIPVSMKPSIVAAIKRLRIHLAQLRRALRACEQAHKTA
jgi:hypothetical protein